jgi:hypothetical protein
VETGTITIGPQTNTEIDSPDPTLADGFGRCEPDGGDPPTAVLSVPGTTTFLESFNSTEPVPPDCDEDEQGDDDCQGEDEQ